MLTNDLEKELHQLAAETFEVEDLVDVKQDAAGEVVPLTSSTSCSCSCNSTTSCSCSCSSCCSCSCSSCSSVV